MDLKEHKWYGPKYFKEEEYNQLSDKGKNTHDRKLPLTLDLVQCPEQHGGSTAATSTPSGQPGRQPGHAPRRRAPGSARVWMSEGESGSEDGCADEVEWVRRR